MPHKTAAEHFEELKAYIAEYHPGGGVAEGSVYVDGKTKMTFRDAAGNRFDMMPESVLRGTWSPYEAANVRGPAVHMEELRKIAEARGGRIAEGSSYVNSDTKMTFIDGSGNRFEMSPNSVKNGHWSPHDAKRSDGDDHGDCPGPNGPGRR